MSKVRGANRFHSGRGTSPEQKLLYYREIDADTGCWLFRGCKRGNYGTLWVWRRNMNAHRVAAILWMGLDPKSELFVLHSCNRRDCFNPEHLRLGTHLDNMRDRWEKGGYVQPDRNRKLNWDAVRLIRELRFKGYSQSRLARAFDVNHDVIRKIMANEIWREVG